MRRNRVVDRGKKALLALVSPSSTLKNCTSGCHVGTPSLAWRRHTCGVGGWVDGSETQSRRSCRGRRTEAVPCLRQLAGRHALAHTSEAAGKEETRQTEDRW
eukprot:6181791-Pleurochrysis_carterae.AAC.4